MILLRRRLITVIDLSRVGIRICDYGPPSCSATSHAMHVYLFMRGGCSDET